MARKDSNNVKNVSNNTNPRRALTAHRILCVVPSLPEDLKFSAIKSILNQTHDVEMLVIFPKRAHGVTVSEKVSAILNEGLSHIKLENFDYILRVDGDTVLPPNFLEENLKDMPDLCGGSGYAMLINTSTFQRVMNSRFHPKSDDSYTSYKFMKENCRITKYRVEPILTRQRGLHHGTSYFSKPKHHNISYFFNRGKGMYRFGYEPFHVFGRLRHSFWNLFALFGYFIALITREEKLDVADFVWHKQVRRLLNYFSR